MELKLGQEGREDINRVTDSEKVVGSMDWSSEWDQMVKIMVLAEVSQEIGSGGRRVGRDYGDVAIMVNNKIQDNNLFIYPRIIIIQKKNRM